MNRDFIDYDTQQKRQPDILFHIEENCVTDDLTLGDVLEDIDANVDKLYEEESELQELNQDIIYILDDISDDLKLDKSIVKVIYLVYLESTQDNILNFKTLGFIPRNTIKQVISELQIRLKNIL